MANIQFGGLITGLDTNALVAGLIKAEQRSVDVLQAQQTSLSGPGWGLHFPD